MLLAALCLQASFLSHPLYLDEAKPELRSAQNILILHDDLEGMTLPYGRDHAQALELATSLRAKLAAGADFAQMAREFSNSRTARNGGTLGSFPGGMLSEPVNSWLFEAEVGELSGVLDSPKGLHILRRIETYAGVLMIQVAGTGAESRALATEIFSKLEAGADFAELALAHSVDLDSAQRGGAYRVFERGSRDVLLKAAAFEAGLGELIGPIETPLGLHIMKRVAPESLPKELWEDNFIRIRAVVVAHLKALNVDPSLNRTQSEAKALAEEVIQRVAQGEDFAEIAARFNDDPGGKQRAGDVGWVYRYNPDLPHFLQRLFLQPPGSMLEAIKTPAGYMVVRREQ